jgi:hypothetical protein
MTESNVLGTDNFYQNVASLDVVSEKRVPCRSAGIDFTLGSQCDEVFDTYSIDCVLCVKWMYDS